jgi:adenylate kinase family enzyme
MSIAIIGNSGSGKTTLARRLAGLQRAPVLDLDEIAWEAGQIAVAREAGAALADVETFCTEYGNWIVEGCYARLIAATLRWEPVLIFLEPGLEVCREHCRRRPWEPGKYKTEAEQAARLVFLLEWVAGYYTREDDLSLAAHQRVFDGYEGVKYKLTSPVELERMGF